MCSHYLWIAIYEIIMYLVTFDYLLRNVFLRLHEYVKERWYFVHQQHCDLYYLWNWWAYILSFYCLSVAFANLEVPYVMNYSLNCFILQVWFPIFVQDGVNQCRQLAAKHSIICSSCLRQVDQNRHYALTHSKFVTCCFLGVCFNAFSVPWQTLRGTLLLSFSHHCYSYNPNRSLIVFSPSIHITSN